MFYKGEAMKSLSKLKQVLIYSFIFLFFISACTETTSPTKEKEEEPDILKEKKEVKITPIPLPDGAKVKEMYLHEVGMSLGPHYLIQRTNEGTFYKFTVRNPLDFINDESKDYPEKREENLFLYSTKAHPSERASVVKLSEEKVRELEELVSNYAVLDWDGFSKHISDDTLDSGDRFEFILTLTDGTSVHAEGYNAVPLGYSGFRHAFLELMEDQLDFSAYKVKNFKDSKATSMLIEIGNFSPWERYAKLELSLPRKQWTLVLKDPKGVDIPKDREISDYGKSEDLPMDYFLEFLSHYGFEELNGYEDPDLTYQDERIVIRIHFEDGKEYDYIGNLSEENGEIFKQDFMQEIQKYYDKVKK